MEVDLQTDIIPDGEIVLEAIKIVKVFCGRDAKKTNGLCCCALHRKNYAANRSDASIRRAFRASLKANGWVHTRKYGWICSECSPKRRKR